MPLRLFMAVPKTILAAMASFGGRDSFAERTDFCRQNSLLPVEKFISGVIDTSEQYIAGVIDAGEQFIAGINDTGNNIFPLCR